MSFTFLFGFQSQRDWTDLTRYGRRRQAGGAITIVVDCNHPEVVGDSLLQELHVESVRCHLFGYVFDQDVPQSLICSRKDACYFQGQ